MKLTAQIFIFGFFFLLHIFFASPTQAQDSTLDLPEPTGDIEITQQPPTPSVPQQPTSPTPTTSQQATSPTPTPEGTVLSAESIQLQAYQPGGACAELSYGDPCWIIDTEVTQVGRNAERARQFIFWVFNNPPIFNAPVLSEIWAITRNIAFIMVAFVIIALALQMVISRKLIGPTFSGISLGLDRVTLFTIFIRVFAVLAFITFSYLIVLGLVQGSEILSRFFIEQLGGQDLFNIVFSAANEETNYDFVGYKNADPLEQDMVFTSLMLVRLTSFTYNFMGIIVILRHIILMFLLVVSPFLALLLPFIFIRNTGTIWIGEFLRWLFYGPLFALFLAALARIWKAGIPYSFDFSRVNTESGQIYNTGVNILYGGPAQVLSETNTANYVDTYAEYIIALIMLWTAILLPWLLLRIFRDYCCDVLEKNQGVLMQILDKIRNLNPPKPPPAPKPTKPGPTSTFGKQMQMPKSQISSQREVLSKEKIVEKMNNRELHTVETHDISKAYNLEVRSLKDVARYDTEKKEQNTTKETLANIQNPLRVSNPKERAQYETLRKEFTTRANKGDKTAKQIIQAATPRASHVEQSTLSSVASEELKKAVETPGKPVVVSQTRVPSTRTISPKTVKSISEKTNIDEKKVEEVLKKTTKKKAFKTQSEDEIREQIEQIAKQLDIAADLIRQIITAVAALHHQTPTLEISSSEFIQKIAQETQTSNETVQKITQEPAIQAIVSQKERELAEEERINQISKSIDITKDQIDEIIKESEKTEPESQTPTIASFTIREVSEKTQMSQDEVERVLEQVPTISNLPKEQHVGALSEKTGIAPNKVKRVLDETPADQLPEGPEPEPTPSISIEEYEEIRTMWMNHYRKSEIPQSDSVKSREDWMRDDIKKLTNTINLLVSPSDKDRQQGMQQVGDLLPFLLLGGFTDIETLTYVKAKLEAAKLTLEEISRVEEAKEEAKKDLEDMETIPAVEPKEEEKTFEQEKKKAMPLPDEEEEKKESNKEQQFDLPGFHEEPEPTKSEMPDVPDLPFKPKSTIIDPNKKK